MTAQIPAILERVRDAGHRVFTAGSYDLNLVGVRSPSRVPEAFDDTLHVVYRESARPGDPAGEGPWVVRRYACTTDPGLYWLRNPGRVEGTAVLAPGQYRGCWELGKHRGQYEALVQRGPVAVYRDRDRDGEIDLTGDPVWGVFGINLHRASAVRTSAAVERWSAGCQVLARPDDFAEVMGLCRKAAKLWGPRFTYTLLEDGP